MKLYAILVCPRCKRKLTFLDCSDEGMYDRALCCGTWWLHPDDAAKQSGSEHHAARGIYTVEVVA